MVMIPATVAAGTYHVEVCTKLDSSGKPGKSLKVGAVQQGAHSGRSGSIIPGCPGA